MSSRNATTIRWALAACYAAISLAGPGLHFVPGSGHAVTIGGKLLYFGVPTPKSASTTEGHGLTAGRPGCESLPIRNSSWCPICKHSFRSPCLAAAVIFVPALPLVQTVAVVRDCEPDVRCDSVFQARAPPAA
jgi:hypothetical protein